MEQLRIHWQRMALSVEDKRVERNQIRIIGKQQVQILQRLRNPEALHFVFYSDVGRILDVRDG